MKHPILIAVLMIGITTAACAQQLLPVLPVASNAGRVDDAQLSPVYVDGKCRFRLKVVQGQRYSDRDYIFAPTKDNPAGWAFGFGCYAGATREEVDGLLAAKRVSGVWIWEATNAPFIPQQHFKVDEFTGANWKGTAVTYDDTTGDESRRGRNLFFCLVERDGPQVLCGGPIAVRALEAPRLVSTYPKILAVLKTIVFVSPPSSAPAPSGTTGGR